MAPLSDLDAVQRQSRRELRFALLAVMLVGALALAPILAPGRSTPAVGWMWRGLPMAIVLGIAALRMRAPNAASASAAWRLLRDDELRRQSLNLACRDALLVVMGAQPLLLALMASASIDAPAALMACATAWGGAATCLLSLLLRDR